MLETDPQEASDYFNENPSNQNAFSKNWMGIEKKQS